VIGSGLKVLHPRVESPQGAILIKNKKKLIGDPLINPV
jgi:hypothetical protein